MESFTDGFIREDLRCETLEPGEKAHIEYSLANLEKGDWTETDVFFRGSQDVIGASKLDEKMLEEIRRQEQTPKELNHVYRQRA